MRFNPFISLLIILVASPSRPASAQIPAQGGSIEGLFSPNSTEQIRPQAQKLFLEGLIAINDASLEEALALLLQAEELDPEQSGITHEETAVRRELCPKVWEVYHDDYALWLHWCERAGT